MAIYLITNYAAPTAAAPVAVTTGTAIKTMLQFAASATKSAKIIQWAISFNGSAAATPVQVELFGCTGAATVTASATADIARIDSDAIQGGDPVTNLIQVGTALTGYTASAEGVVAGYRAFDEQFIAPTNQYVLQFPLGREPVIKSGEFARIRVTAPSAVLCICSMIVEI